VVRYPRAENADLGGRSLHASFDSADEWIGELDPDDVSCPELTDGESQEECSLESLDPRPAEPWEGATHRTRTLNPQAPAFCPIGMQDSAFSRSSSFDELSFSSFEVGQIVSPRDGSGEVDHDIPSSPDRPVVTRLVDDEKAASGPSSSLYCTALDSCLLQ
jgi:hypothetical protein